MNSCYTPKVLVLTPRFPYPVVGGDRLRIFEICKELSKYCNITLLSLCDSREEMHMIPPDDGVFQSIHRVFLPKLLSYFNAVCALPTGTPLQVAYYRSSKFNRKFRSLLHSHDLVLSHLLRAGDYMKDINKPSVVEMTDAISMNYERSTNFRNLSGFRSAIYSIESKRLKSYEVKSICHHDLLTFVSAVDARFLYGDPLPANVLICGNGVDTSLMSWQFRSNPEPVVAFIGNMVSLQNQDAAMWFASEILPALNVHGNFRFRIVGQIPPKTAERFRKLSGVEVTGKVESIPEAVRDCFAAVCPIRIGAGVQNKLLEYMALGLPSVTTSVGQEGLGIIDGTHVLVADTPEATAGKLHLLWQNRGYARQLSESARRYVVDCHSWSSMLSPLVSNVVSLSKLDKQG